MDEMQRRLKDGYYLLREGGHEGAPEFDFGVGQYHAGLNVRPFSLRSTLKSPPQRPSTARQHPAFGRGVLLSVSHAPRAT